jgi:hypothetical protein
VTVAVALGASALAGGAAILAIAQAQEPNPPGGGDLTGASVLDADHRVIVRSTAEGCDTMLVKVPMDGDTVHAAGTCFRVG